SEERAGHRVAPGRVGHARGGGTIAAAPRGGRAVVLAQGRRGGRSLSARVARVRGRDDGSALGRGKTMGGSYRGMVLAAGLGTRLAPLTDVVPKPLLPIGPERLIESAIRRLRAAGIVEIAVNLHHLGEMISETLGTGESLDCRLHYFREPEILGTAGALRNAA